MRVDECKTLLLSKSKASGLNEHRPGRALDLVISLNGFKFYPLNKYILYLVLNGSPHKQNPIWTVLKDL